MEEKEEEEEGVLSLTPGALPLSDDELQVEHKRVISKVAWRVLPLVWLLYFFSFISRTNLTNMHVVLMRDIDLSESQFGLCLGAFYISYFVFQIPSNLILERMRMNMWLALLLFVWGCITMLSVFITDAATLILTRFCLGIAEAGFAPGMVYYISLWFGERFRAQKLSLMQSAVCFSYAVSGIISSVVLSRLDGALGMSGWRWLYILTGFPILVLSGVFYHFLPNSPQEAKFLNEWERKILLRERGVTAAVWTVSQRTSPALFWSTIKNTKNWMFSICGLFFVLTIAGVNGFTPAIMYELGSPVFVSNFLVAIPNLVAVVALIAWSYHSDHNQERFWHIFIAMFAALIALGFCVLFVFFVDLGMVLGLLTVYQSAINSGYSVLIAYMCASVLGSTSIAIGLYYSVCAVGGWLGPFLMGYSRDTTGDHALSLALMCGSLALGIGLFSTIYITQRTTQSEFGSSAKMQQREASSTISVTGSATETEEEEEPKGEVVGEAIIV